MADNSPNPIPFSEPPYLRGLPSPYHTPAHFQFQKRCRQFLWKHLISHAMEWERAGIVPLDVFGTFCKHNLLVALLPPPLPMRWLKDLNIHDILGVDIQDWDYMYTAIFVDEVTMSPSLSIRYLVKSLTGTDESLWPGRTSRSSQCGLLLRNSAYTPIRLRGTPRATATQSLDRQSAHMPRHHRA